MMITSGNFVWYLFGYVVLAHAFTWGLTRIINWYREQMSRESKSGQNRTRVHRVKRQRALSAMVQITGS